MTNNPRIFLKVAAMGVMLVAVAGCGLAKHIPTDTVRVDSVYIVNTEKEIVRDSIFVTEKEYIREKGDTVYIEKLKTEYRDRWRDREVHDTTYVDKEIEKVVEKEVEKELTWGQRFRLKGFWYLTAIILGFFLWKSRKLWMHL